MAAAFLPFSVAFAAAPIASAETETYAELRAETANGFDVYFGLQGNDRGRAAGSAFATDGAAGALYYSARADGSFEGNRWDVRVGDIGSVRTTRFIRESRRVRRAPRCKGRLVVLRGHFEGEFEFNGEGGYASLSATRVNGKVIRGDLRDCESVETEPTRPPRNQIALSSCRSGASEAEYYGFAAGHGHEAIHVASLNERDGRVFVWRSVFLEAEPSSFTYTKDLTGAAVSPPAPFIGTGELQDRRLTGDLAVNLLGRPEAVPLTPARARLQRTRGTSASSPCGAVIVFEAGNERQALRPRLRNVLRAGEGAAARRLFAGG